MADTTLPGVLLSGTHSGRPAASAVANGTLYAETDTGQTYQSDGVSTWTAWGAVAGGGGALGFDYATVATDQSTTSSSFTDLATAGPAVTLTVNTKVKVTISAFLYNTNTSSGCAMGVDLSSANTVAASDAQSMVGYTIDGIQISRVLYFSGLTPGSTVFTAKYKRTANTAHFIYRTILVECMD